MPIRKMPITGPISVEATGLVGDQQADKSVHGGVEKALHIYPADHYKRWQNELPYLKFKFRPGSFGENLCVEGMTETSACIGDVFRLGNSIIQISQGRTPCWKLAAHVGMSNFPKLFLESGRTGWYARILVPGKFFASDPLVLCERPNPGQSVHMVTKERVSSCTGTREASRLSELVGLSQNWTNAFGKKALRI